MVQIVDNSGNASGLGVNSDHEVLATLNKDINKVGQVAIGAEINPDGEGVGRLVRPADISPDYRVRIGTDSTLFNDNYSHAQINVSKYKVNNTTATNALSGGRWVLNNGNSVTSGQGTQIVTWDKFNLVLSSVLYVDFVAQFAQDPQTNVVAEMGIGYVSGVAAPTDGVMFRMNASGVLQGIINIGGSETAVSLVSAGSTPFVPLGATSYHFLIVIHNDRTEFWIDNVLTGAIPTPAAFGSPFLSMSAPLFARIYNSGTVTTAQRLELSNVSVTSGDVNTNRLWATAMAAQGNSAVNVPDGTAAGFTANYANAAAPTNVAALSATTAGYATLGGQWSFTALAGAETDFVLFAYLNPAGTNAIPAKNLIVRGVRIETMNMGAAVATTPTTIQYGLAVGSTAITLATADSATAGTRAPRRITLGLASLPIGSVIGYVAPPVDVNMDAPIVVEPGTYLHILVKVVVGTATASQIVRGTCFVNGYFE